jgi:hypothetical protein
MGKINLWDNDIFTTKGAASYLITPRLRQLGRLQHGLPEQLSSTT